MRTTTHRGQPPADTTSAPSPPVGIRTATSPGRARVKSSTDTDEYVRQVAVEALTTRWPDDVIMSDEAVRPGERATSGIAHSRSHVSVRSHSTRPCRRQGRRSVDRPLFFTVAGTSALLGAAAILLVECVR
jgi:hypothetical protein